MLTDPKEIEIIAQAKQKNVRDPNRSRQHFLNILEDFFKGVKLDGRYLDMGPGQYDFGMLAREHGGTCVGLDFDPAVIALGNYKGFDTVELNIQKLPQQPLAEKFDGIFNKFTLNAFWHWDDEAKHRELVDCIVGMMKPGAWAWIAPWNGVPKKAELSAAQIAQALAIQSDAFKGHGFVERPISGLQSRRYGIHGTIANNVIFTKELSWRGA